ncbi:sensor histidine kinase [Caulobacter sp. 17J65-9]|uniref:sensor histidine kinase n=1 Tax=Caulobacter sp. 17J65-9 TaxID=2709382 RepID=UPI0013CC2D8B|nr:sensor histidine kinase [Caulobacter sp. 17J65-9]NEX94236.1 sensor histidine kinase [Caulobacter sp. 17J65-9]
MSDASGRAAPFAAGAGEMAAKVRAFDWASTPLGPVADWPAELKTAVGFMLDSHFPKAVVWGPGLVTIYNDAFRPILGDKPEALGRSWAEIWSEVWTDIGAFTQRAFAGQATYIEDLPLTILRSDAPEQAFFTFCYGPLRLADGTVAGMMDTVMETTATVKARAQMAMLNAELGHRMKNTLALVQAIANQTLREVDPRKPVEAFSSRLTALGRAHDVLLQQDWAAASLRQVVDATLAPLDGLRQVRIEGPDLTIGSRAAVQLSLLLHELATNAAKYGALSAPDGRVRLVWSADAELLRMSWREAGGPPIGAPQRTSFGSRLIDLGLGGTGRVTRRYPESGFEADVEAPLRELSA